MVPARPPASPSCDGQQRDSWQERDQDGSGDSGRLSPDKRTPTLSTGHGAVLGDTDALSQGRKAGGSRPGFGGEGPRPAPRRPRDGASEGRAVTDVSPPTNTKLHLPGNISKNCTSDGWSKLFPDFGDACGFEDPEDSQVGLCAPCLPSVPRARVPRARAAGVCCPAGPGPLRSTRSSQVRRGPRARRAAGTGVVEAGKAGSVHVHAAEPRAVPCPGASPPAPTGAGAGAASRTGRRGSVVAGSPSAMPCAAQRRGTLTSASPPRSRARREQSRFRLSPAAIRLVRTPRPDRPGPWSETSGCAAFSPSLRPFLQKKGLPGPTGRTRLHLPRWPCWTRSTVLGTRRQAPGPGGPPPLQT